MDTIVESLRHSFRNYFNFGGDATKQEFLTWMGFTAIVWLFLTITEAWIFSLTGIMPFLRSTDLHFWFATDIFCFLVITPTLAVTVRRLRSTEHSPYWIIVWAVMWVCEWILCGFLFVGYSFEWFFFDLSLFNINPLYWLSDSISLMFPLGTHVNESIEYYGPIWVRLWPYVITHFLSLSVNIWTLVWATKDGETDSQFSSEQFNPSNIITSPVLHYIGFGILGYIITGMVMMFLVGSIPGLAGLLAIGGAVAGVLLTRQYKNSQLPQSESYNPVNEETSIPDNNTSPVCTECGDTSPEEATYCISCGNKLPELICPNCQTENISRAKFCMGCGQVR